MIETVLFEVDGVLADTRRVRGDAVRRALAHDGIAVSAEELDARGAGLPMREAVARVAAHHGAARDGTARDGMALDETALDLAAARAQREVDAWLAKGLTLAAGAAELVRELHGRVRLGVVSRLPRREVGLVLSLADLEAAFECVVAEEDAAPPKPDPAPYRAALARLARRRPVDPARAVALEDGALGIRAARAAGIRCVAVGPVPAHEAIAADALLDSLQGQSLRALESLLASTMERTR